MPAKWSRPVFSFRFYEGKISRALTVIRKMWMHARRNDRRSSWNDMVDGRRLLRVVISASRHRRGAARIVGR
jgi:hypothetical protein